MEDTLDGLPTIQGDDGRESKLLANRYKVIRKLGEGGMGMVYLAEDTELGNNKVAIKFIPPMLAGNTRAVKNLKKEARTAMQLSHPNIVRLHDLHTDGHQKFLVMEYIEGKTLEEILADKDNDKLTLEELLPIAEHIAAGLDYAHSKNVLHRDLKPSNIMIGKSGTVKVLDFGIAREMRDSYTRVTGQETSGTLPYMSPEQLMGVAPTIGMDIYSLGAVLYECLSGQPPFHRGDIPRQIESKKPDDLPDVPQQYNDAIMAALAKKATDRPSCAAELVEMLKGKKKAKPYKTTLSYDEKVTDQTRITQVKLAGKPKSKVKWWVAIIILALTIAGVFYGVREYQVLQRNKKAAELWSRSQDFANKGEYDLALSVVNDMMKKYPESLAAKEALVQRPVWEKRLIGKEKAAELWSQAHDSANRRDYEQALASVTELVKKYPDSSLVEEVLDKKTIWEQEAFRTYFSTGLAYEAEQDWEKAVESYTKATTFKNDPSTQSKLEEAKKILQQRQEQYQKISEQARNAENQGNLSEAVKLFQEAIEYANTKDIATLHSKIDSLNSQIGEQEKQKKFAQLLNQARLKDNRENGKEALKLLEQVLALDPNHTEALALKKKIEEYYSFTNTLGMKFVYIPPGFIDSRASKKVQVNGFYVGITEVTEAQWKALKGALPDRISSRSKGPEFPMCNITWFEAHNFCQELGQKEGKVYRLPTEVEWESACRAGTNTRYSFGDDDSLLAFYAWYTLTANSPQPVAQKKPNPWGLFDMHGNVWEWCQDYRETPRGDRYYCCRGGGFKEEASKCCSDSYKEWRSGNMEYRYVGFRIVLHITN